MNPWKISRILVATDLLESSRLSLDYAVAIAHHYGATVILLNVVELSQPAREAELGTSRPSVSRKLAQARLAALAESVAPTGVAVEHHVLDGTPSDVILESVKRFKADLLVMGVHGVHRGLEHLLIGSNTERILLSAACPTLTVGAHVLAGVALGFHPTEILYFSDFSDEAVRAAQYALQLAREFKAPVDVCQLLAESDADDPARRDEMVQRYCEKLSETIGSDHPEWTDPPCQLDRGMEVDELIDRAQSRFAGLIVLGVHVETTFDRHLHSSFAYRLLARATCPVLTIGREPSRLS